MTTPHKNSPDVLCEEILAEAGRECAEIIRRAEQESASLLAAATAEAEKVRREKLAAARAEAARRTELMLATIPVETGRLRSAHIEVILESIHEGAQLALHAHHFDSHETVVALASEAIRQMPGTDFVLKISAADFEVGQDQLAAKIFECVGRSPLKINIVSDPMFTSGDVLIQDTAGFRVWDNRLQSRLERLWPELRRQIALQTQLFENSTTIGGAT